jgi:hypothetical protein
LLMFVSLTPSFSRVLQATQRMSRFNGFPSLVQTVETVCSLFESFAPG